MHLIVHDEERIKPYTGLLESLGVVPGSDHFVLAQRAEVNPDTAIQILEAGCKIFDMASYHGNLSRWLLGNLWTILEEAGQDPHELISELDVNYNTAITSAKTFKFYRGRIFDFPFSLHKEIVYSKDLSDELKLEISQYAEDNTLTLNQTRGLIRVLQNAIRDGEDIPDIEEAFEAQEKPSNHGKRHIIIQGDGSRVLLEGVPTTEQVAQAEEVYEIRRVLKGNPERRGEPDLERDVRETEPSDDDSSGGEVREMFSKQE